MSKLPFGLRRISHASNQLGGFSLVEVAMAIAIIGFAFVALLGMLPSGMRIFRSSIDSANENWIIQDVNATLQTTVWSKLPGMAADKGGDVFIYDEEGKLIDRVGLGSVTDPSGLETKNWQYAVRVLVDPAIRPNQTENYTDDTRLVTVVISQIRKAKAMEEFVKITKIDDIKSDSFRANSGLRTRSFIITRMDSAFD